MSKKTYEVLDTLAEFPEIGPLELKRKEIRGFTIVKQVNIFYKVKGNTLIILNFFDNRQSPAKKKYRQ